MGRNEGLLDVGEIKRAIDILKPNGELYEIRILKGNEIYSGYFKNTDTMIAALSQVDLRGLNTYITLNTIDNACYARAQKDKFIRMYRDGDTTKDKHIIRYKWLLIDLDPERVSGVSSTNDELSEAKKLAPKVKSYLSGIGFREPIWAISGNGIHLLYRIDLEANDKSKELMEAALKSLDILFSNDAIKLDTTVYNPSRICKLYGTMAQKGASTEDRPHRMSRIVKVPDTVQITSRKCIEALAAVYKDLNPPAPKSNKPSSYTPKDFDIEEWLNRYGLRYTVKEAKDYTKFILDECPFDSSHKAPDAMITRGSSGEIGFKCLHDHCSCYKWRDVRIKYEPDAYEQKGKSAERINKGWEQHKQLKSNPPEKPPDEETTAASESFTLECLADIEESNQDFLFDPMIPIGQITALGGAGGVGKTNIICSVVAGVSNGDRSILGEINPDVGNRVVFFTSEDSIGKVIKKRLKRYKANLKNVFTIQLEDTEKFSKIKFDSPAIKEIIEEYKPTLMVFDPVQSFLPEHINISSRSDIRAALNPLIGYGQKYNVSFIILMHSNKKIGTYGRSRMADSAEFWDMCRCVLIVGEADRNGLKYISHEKTNYGKLADTILFTIEEGKVVSKGTTDKKDRDFIENEAKMVYEAPVKNKARDLIIEYLESVESNKVEIRELDTMAKANSISSGTMRNAKDELKDEGVIRISHTGFGKDIVWYCELVNKVS